MRRRINATIMEHVGIHRPPSQDVVVLVHNGLKTALVALPEIVKNILARSGVPGAAVAVVHGGKTVFAQGFGVRQRGKPALIDADTVFQVASVSKPLTASVIAVEVTNSVAATPSR